MNTFTNDFRHWDKGAPLLNTGGSLEFRFWNLGAPYIDLSAQDPDRLPPVPWPTSLPVPYVDSRINVSAKTDVTLFESGRSRYRRLILLPFETIDVQWMFTGDQFETFKNYFEQDLDNGSRDVAVEIYGRARTMVFAESTYDVNRSDNLFNVSAKLEYLDPSVTAESET